MTYFNIKYEPIKTFNDFNFYFYAQNDEKNIYCIFFKFNLQQMVVYLF